MKNMQVYEEGGLYAVFGNEGIDPAASVCYGLHALQHRGQSTCGIAVWDGERIKLAKGKGLVIDYFNAPTLEPLKGGIAAVGHIRKAAEGRGSSIYAQPLTQISARGEMAIAFTGSILNKQELMESLMQDGVIFQTGSDCEVFANLLSRAKGETAEAIREAVEMIKGSYSVAVLMHEELYVMRDPSGNQPLVLGKKNGNYLISSENCGFVMIEGELIRNMLPGEILRINREGVTSQTLEMKAQKRCIYEYLYYARPDSVIDGVGIYDARMHFGRKLAQVLPVEADMVVGVPDSALAAAAGYAEASGIPQGDGLYKNRYSGISKATLQKRDRGVRLKLNAIKENVAGKRIILIDDSIVAGTTSKWIVEMLKSAGATEVHLRIASPAFQRPCCYGLYSFSQSKLISAGHSEEEMKALMGVDSFACLSLDMMLEGLDVNPDDFCGQCFCEKLK